MKRKILKALREQAKINPAFERAEEVYEWSAELTAETRYIEGNFNDYYITEDGNRLHFKLTHMHAGLIGVVGLQGSGKTSLLQVLANDVKSKGNRTFFESWTPKSLQRMEEENNRQTYPADSIYSFLSTFRYIFIDLPDYSKTHRGQMNKDLRVIEDLWKGVQRVKSTAKVPNIFVLGVQQEMFKDHFLFGKLDVVELSPLKPTEMVEAYKKKWTSTEPFTIEALTLITELSRGIFRRFYKYIQKCIEEAIIRKKDFPIATEYVREAINFDQLVKDMDLELSDVFKQKEQKYNAVKLLNHLRQKGEANQKEIAEELEINEMAAGRLVRTLELHGYVKRNRAEHGQWKVSLA